MTQVKKDYWVLAVLLSLAAYFIPTIAALKSNDGIVFVAANALGSWTFIFFLMWFTQKSKKWSGFVGCCLLTGFAVFLIIRQMFGPGEGAGVVGADLGFVGAWAMYCWLV